MNRPAQRSACQIRQEVVRWSIALRRCSTETPILTIAFAAAGLCSSPAAQQVWVVDDDGGPGVDFTDVQPAADAASPGDVLLVKAGGYSSLVLNGTSLSVIAEDGEVALLAGASVRQISATQRVYLAGLQLNSATEAGLQIKTNQGHVFVEDCRITGAGGDGLFTSSVYHPDGYPGVEISNSAAVSIARCESFGGDGDDYAPLAASHGFGGAGILIDASSSVGVHGSILHGGDGGDVFDDDAAWDGGWGGPGIEIHEGVVVAVGNQLHGGDGGVAGEDMDIFSGYSCGWGGAAGDGISQGFTFQRVTIHMADNSFIPGVPGPPYPSAPCPSGAPGSAVDVTTASVDPMATRHYGLVVSSPLREGQTVSVSVTGPPNALVYLAVASRPGWFFLPTLGGLGLVDPFGFQLLALGVTSAGGRISVGFPTPTTVPAGEGLGLFLQAVGLELASPNLPLGSPAGLTLLDASL